MKVIDDIVNFLSKLTFGNILRWVTFLTLSVLIGFLSWNLFTGLAQDAFHQNILGVAAIAVESLKILALISANTFLFLASIIKKKNIRLFINKDHNKLNTIADDKVFLDLLKYKSYMKKAVLSFIFYGVCSITTLSSSLGFVLESVEQGKSLAVGTEISIIDRIQSVKDTNQGRLDMIEGRKDTIKSQKDTIDNNNNIIAERREDLKVLDKKSETYSKDKARLDNEIRALLATNTRLTTSNTDLLNLNTQDLTQNTTDLQGAQTTAVTENKEKKEEKKSMYTLMGEAIGIPADKIRFFLLFLLSMILEVGLFYTAPHMYKIEEEDKKDEAVREITEEETVVPLNQGSRRGRPLGSKNKPKVLSESTIESNVDVTVQKKLDPLSEALVGDMAITLPIEEPIAEEEFQGALEVAPSIPEGTQPSDHEKIISALWDNDGNKYLKDLHLAAKEVNVPFITAQAVFQWLQGTKYEGYPMIEFRTSSEKWYPNVTSEIAKKLAKR